MIQIASDNAEKLAISAGPDLYGRLSVGTSGRTGLILSDSNSDVATLGKASIKGAWKFDKTRGALLVLTKPRITSLPSNSILKKLVKVPILLRIYLVTEVVKCPAYALYLSNKSEHIGGFTVAE